MRLAFVLALALVFPATARAETKMRVAVLAHAPSVPRAAEVAEDVASSLVAQEFAVLSRRRLLEHLVNVARGMPDPLAGARAKIAEADARYLDLDLDAAGAALREAEEQLSPALGDPEAVGVLRQVLERRALVLLTQGRTDPAAEMLNRLYVLDPDYRPDPRLLAPQFAPAFEKARAATASASRGALVVSTVPPGADVYVDGRWAGAAPVTVELRAGQHVVQARHASHDAAGAFVTVDAAARAEFPLRLAAQTSDARKQARAREVAANTLPAPRARIADEVRNLTGAAAVVVVVARVTADGPRAFVEVHRADQPGVPARSAELPLASGPLAKEAAKLLEAPAATPDGDIAPPRFVTRRTVRNPLLLGVVAGPKYFYGTGWGRLGGVPPAAGALGLQAGFRLEEERSSVVDLVASASIANASGCASSTNPCTAMQVDTLAMDIAPRLVVPIVRRLQWYAQVGVGAVSSEVRVFPASQPERSDGVLAVSVHAGSGVTFVAHRRFLVGLDARVTVADAPSPALEDLTGIERLNVGGSAITLVFGTRL